MKTPRTLVGLVSRLVTHAAFAFATALTAAEVAPKVGALGALAALEFQGNASFSPRALRAGLEGTPELLLASHPAAPLDEYLATLQRTLVRGYRNEGFPDATVALSVDSSRPAVRAAIVEGPRFLHGPIAVTGTRDVPAKDIVRALSEPRAAQPNDRLERAVHRVLERQREPAKAPEGQATAANAPVNNLASSTLDSLKDTSNDALWESGKPASFREDFPAEVEEKVRALLAEHGHPLATIAVALEPDRAKRLVRLAVRVTEGPRAIIGTITIRGNQRDSADDILRATGLKSGRELTPAVLAQARLALWNSARFFAFDLKTQPRDPTSREIDLGLDVVENDARPPLREPLPRHEAALVRFANWMTTQATRSDFALAGTVGDGTRYGVAMSSTRGIGFSIESAGGETLAGVISTRGSRLLATAGGRTGVHEFTGSMSQLDGFLWFVSHGDPEKSGRNLDLTMGASFSGMSATPGDKSTNPAAIDLIVAPAFACEALTRDATPKFERGEVVMTDQHGQPTARFREDTGELIDWRIVEFGEENGGPPGGLRFSAGRAEFDRIAAAVKSAWPAAGARRDAFSAVLFAHPLVAPKLTADQGAAAARATIAKWRLGALLAEGFLGSPDVQAWFMGNPDDKDPDFSIPDPPGAAITRPGGLAAAFASSYYKLAASLWPVESWPAKLARELYYISADRTKYTAAVMEELDRDPRMGPIGSIMAAQLLHTLDPQLAARFARRAVARGTAEDFRRDWELVLEGNATAGRIAQHVVRALGALDPREIDELLAALPPAEAQVLRRAFASLRTQPDVPLVELLRPHLDEWWERHLRPLLPARLVALLPDLEPIGATGYNARGVLRLQHGDLDAALADFNQALALDPQLAAGFLGRSGVKLQRDDYASALADANRAIALDPKLARAYAIRAGVATAQGNIRAAIADCDQAIRLDASDDFAFTVRGNAKSRSGDHAGAIADHTRAIELAPHMAEGYYNRAADKFRQGDLDGTIADSTRAIELDPKAVIAYQNRGAARVQKGDQDGAAADFDQAVALAPHQPQHHFNRAKFRQVERRDYAGAVADYTRGIELSSAPADGYNGRGSAKQAAGDLDGAIADFTRAIELNPGFVLAYTNRSNARQAKGDATGAASDRQQAARLAQPLTFPAPTATISPATTAPTAAIALVRSGDTKRAQRKFDDAIADYTAALKLTPDLIPALLGRGMAHDSKQDYARSLRDFDRVIQLNPKSAEAHNGRGFAQAGRGNFQAAIADYDRAIQLNPRFSAPLNNRGLARRAQGDLAAALADFDEAIRLSPRYTNAFSNRASTRQALGDLAGAVADYDQSVATGTTTHYSQLYRFLCQRRLGREPSAPDFAQAVDRWPNGWAKTLGTFVAGKITADELLRLAGQATGRTATSRLCEGHFIVGLDALITGRADVARGHFEQSVAQNRPGLSAFIMARAELARLTKAAP